MSLETPSAEKGPEKIVAAAMRYRGEMFVAPTHAAAIEKLLKVFPDWETAEDLETAEQGFLTSKNRFVDRAEAGSIARAAGQLDHVDPSRVDEVEAELETSEMPPLPGVES